MKKQKKELGNVESVQNPQQRKLSCSSLSSVTVHDFDL